MQSKKLENKDLQQAISFLNLDVETIESAKVYYESFHENIKYLNDDKEGIKSEELVIACSVLVAAKCRKIKSLNGEQTSGVGISFSHIIKFLKSLEFSFDVIPNFLFTLDKFLNFMIIDDTVKEELKEISGVFKFNQKLFYKFIQLFDEMGFTLKIGETMRDKNEVFKIIKSLSWMLFIIFKRKLFESNHDIVDNFCLLTSIIYIIIQGLPSYLNCAFIEDIYQNENQEVEFFLKLKKKLCVLIKLSNFEQLDSILDNVLREIKELANKISLKYGEGAFCSNSCLNIFNDETWEYNCLKLENEFQKLCKDFEDMDERCFLEQKKSFTPLKFTPFVKQSDSHRLLKSSFAIPLSKTLNYELTNKMNEKCPMKELKFFPMQSPSIMKSPSINLNHMQPPATPMSAAMELNNWLYEMNKRMKMKVEDKKLEETKIINLIEKVLSKTRIVDKKTRIDHVLALYFFVLDKFEEEEIKKPKFKASIVACCLEILFYILNNTEITIDNLLSLIEIDPYDFWTKIRVFIGMGVYLPQSIKENFYDIEKYLLMKSVWAPNTHISTMIFKFLEQVKEGEEAEKQLNKLLNLQEQFFFKRVLHLTALQIQEISFVLKLDNNMEEAVWTLMKEILSCHCDIIIDRSIVQFILCCFYALCKIMRPEREMTFKEIIFTYVNISNNKKNSKTAIYSKSDNGAQIHIILMYNEVFVPKLSPQLKRLKEKPNEALSFKAKIPLLNASSPLKQSISKQNSDIFASPMKKVMTPFSSGLFVQPDKFFHNICKLDLDLNSKNNNSENEVTNIRPNSVLLDRIRSKGDSSKLPSLSIKSNQLFEKKEEMNSSLEELLNSNNNNTFKRIIRFEEDGERQTKKKLKIEQKN